MNCSTPGFPIHHQLPELTQTHAHRISDAIQPFHPLPSPSPPAFNPSQASGFFSNESVLHIRWSKYWSFSFSISLCNEYSGLISSRMDWLDLLDVQGTPQFSTIALPIYIPTKSTGGFPSLHCLDVYSLIFINLTKMPSRNVSHVTLPKAYEKPCLPHLHQQQLSIL